MDKDRKPVCETRDVDGKCTNPVTPYAKTDGWILLEPNEYQAQIHAAQDN